MTNARPRRRRRHRGPRPDTEFTQGPLPQGAPPLIVPVGGAQNSPHSTQNLPTEESAEDMQNASPETNQEYPIESSYPESQPEHTVSETPGDPSLSSPPHPGQVPYSRHHRHPHPRPHHHRNSHRNVHGGPHQGYHGAQQGGLPGGIIPTLEHRCVRQFPRIALGRGREYFNSGRVSDPVWTGKECSVQIKGGGGDYKLVFDFSQIEESRRLPANCDCPAYIRGALCKHIWAAILQIDKTTPAGTIPESGVLKLVHAYRGNPSAQQQQPPLPRPREAGAPAVIIVPAKIDTSAWIEKLNQLQGLSTPTSTRAASNRSLASFVIAASETLSTGKLVLDLWTRHRAPNGELGPLRPGRLLNQDFSQFEEIRDQETMALLTRSCEPKIFAPFGRSSGNISTRFSVSPIFEPHILPALAGAGKLFLSRSPNGSPDSAERPLRMDRGKTWDLELRIEAVGTEHYRLDGFFKRDGEMRSLSEPIVILRSGFLIFEDRIGRFTEARHATWASALRPPSTFLVLRNQGDALLSRLLLDSSAPRITWPAEMGWTQTKIDPRPKGVFRPLGNDPSTGRMTLTVSFDYAGKDIALSDQDTPIVDAEQKRVYSRNLAFEEKTLLSALEILRDPQGTGTVPLSDMPRAANELCAAGWSVYIENRQVRVANDFSMNVSSSTDWFDLKLEATFGGTSVTQAALLAALKSKSGLIQLADGSVGMLPEGWFEKFASISQLGNEFGEVTESGTFRFSRSQGLMLNAALSDEHLNADSHFLTFREKIRQFEVRTALDAPDGFKGTLRNYQKEGLTWLRFLEAFETGGILADDMGLGKTIQILAFLQARAAERKLPSIVVTPKSLAFNWMDEAKTFVPGLKVVRYAGTGRTLRLKDIREADLVVTTYGALRTDIEKLKDIEFDIAIVDEAQAIKNAKSQAAIACKKLQAHHRLALTGTPIENSLNDLLSILEFTNPGLLRYSQQKELGKDTQSALARVLKPFMLRRTKEKVLTELPDKSEQILFCEMGPDERQFYTALRDQFRASLTEKSDGEGTGRSNFHVLEALLRLRQAACHSGLIDPARKSEPSAKLQLLINHIQEVAQEGHKLLVFSQFTSLLALVRTRLEEEGIVYEYLDGQTEDRKSPVEKFQTDPKVPVFLISLKAGGTGLNLTAADYVFILDPWWNPATEAQAIGRAHRMGQSRKVFAYRMIAKGTVEEKILELQKSKRELAESIISEDQDFMGKLSRVELEQLLT